MSDTPYTLWCYVEGDKNLFGVIISSTTTIDILKISIKESKSNFLQGVDASNLTLTKVRYIMIPV
jgi:hypothetical protein